MPDSLNRSRRTPDVRTDGSLPRWIFLPASVGLLLVALPLVALGSRVDVREFGNLITSPSSLAALRLSLVTSTLATLLCVVFGVPLALLLARTRFRGQQLRMTRERLVSDG